MKTLLTKNCKECRRSLAIARDDRVLWGQRGERSGDSCGNCHM